MGNTAGTSAGREIEECDGFTEYDQAEALAESKNLALQAKYFKDLLELSCNGEERIDKEVELRI